MIDLVERQHRSARHYLTEPSPDSALSKSVTLTARHFGFPVAALNVLDRCHQHTIAVFGAAPQVCARADSLCDRVVRTNRPWIARNLDHRLNDTVIATYVGVPLCGREGLPVATLCLIDNRSRTFDQADLDELLRAAEVVQDQLELQRRQHAQQETTPLRSAAIIRALENDEIVPWFQPIVDLNTSEVHGVEALARWRRGKDVTELPDTFLPAAESSDVIMDVDLAVLDRAARAVGGSGIGLNVNLSTRHLRDPTAVDRIAARVLATGSDPRSITFEITETAALSVGAHHRTFLADLRSRGFRVVLDDFGTGFSAIGHVLHLPVDGIKIDRSVTRNLQSRAGRAVLRALVQLADDLDLDTCLEGVETELQADLARELGCRSAQGFLFGRPAPTVPR